MPRIPSIILICAILSLFVVADVVGQDGDFEQELSFEAGSSGTLPAGWGGGPAETIFLDTVAVHSGVGAARITREADSPREFTSLTRSLPAEVEGEYIELQGFLRTEDVTGFVGLWLREDGRSGSLHFDNMYERGLKGTTDWADYAVRLPLDPNAHEIFFGVLLQGEGQVWADDLELLVDGRPIREAPGKLFEPTILDTDQSFDDGSGIEITSLSPEQTEHLAVLGKVWGFLKYHHPDVASGEHHWDYELFRVLRHVLDARDTVTRNDVIADWIDRIGMPDACQECARAAADAYLLPRLDWIRDEFLVGTRVAEQLQSIHEHRFSGSEQFFVSQVPGVGNPVFANELGYEEQRPPDAGYRMLAVLRLWNIAEYWFPYRDLIDDEWDAVLREFLPRIVEADTWEAYQLQLLAFIARLSDTHANLWSAVTLRPPRGDCFLPVALRYVRNQFVVVGHTSHDPGFEPVLRLGDAIVSLDDAPVDSLAAAWSPYYAASNEVTRMRDIARLMPRGDCGDVRVGILREGRNLDIETERISGTDQMPRRHDRPGDTFQLLSSDVAYLKLSSVKSADVDSYIERAQGTHGLIIDIRNYPSEFMVFSLGSRLIDDTTSFARFTVGDPSNPGAFLWTDPIRLIPQEPGYDGKVVILVNESSISQSEYTAMAFRASPRSLVVGSTTAAADGNVSRIPLPGGLSTMISGIGVFYPDKTPTQRVGIVPDVEVRPTIDGIREGRDEVLEEAIRQILGDDADDAEVRRMAKPPVSEE